MRLFDDYMGHMGMSQGKSENWAGLSARKERKLITDSKWDRMQKPRERFRTSRNDEIQG